jgi:hypothetical protein
LCPRYRRRRRKARPAARKDRDRGCKDRPAHPAGRAHRYLIEQALANELPGREIATLLTQVEVDAADPAFAAPTKPIGPVYGEAEACALATRTDWTFVADGGGFRRAVASPAPRRIREINVIRLLAEADMLVICAGGGGIPVVATQGGALRGVEAVIDKDLSAALLAEQVGADALLLLTDVPAVRTQWPPPQGEPIARATPSFDPGSMGPPRPKPPAASPSARAARPPSARSRRRRRFSRARRGPRLRPRNDGMVVNASAATPARLIGGHLLFVKGCAERHFRAQGKLSQ